MTNYFKLLATIGLTTSAAFCEVPAAHAAYEVPPVFNAAKVIDASSLQGPYHRVRDSAPSDGYLIHFTIDSDFGVFECAGLEELNQRVREIGAIAKLVEVSKGDLFAEGLKRSVEQPIDAVKNIVENPAKAVVQAPKTVGHFFKKVGSSVGNAAKRAGKRIESAAGGESNGGEALAQTGRGIGNAAKSAAGFDQAKLECARQLGVDPYSDNPRLQEEMEKVTWAFFAGGLPLRIGAMAASGGASAALTATKVLGLPEDIYDITPAELALRDRESLEAMGVDAATIDAVVQNPALSVSLRHGIVESLKRLPGPGRTGIVQVATTCEQQRQVVFLNRALRMLVSRHGVSPYASVRAFGRLPAALTAEGVLEVAAPVDYVSWTAEVADFAARDDLGATGRRLVLEANLSKAATAGLEAAGWQVITVK